MANTFFKAQGHALGDSLVEDEAVDTARRLLSQAGDRILLPHQVVIADAFAAAANTQIISVDDGVPDGWRILDVGPDTVLRFGAEVASARLIVWNGPLGVFELEPFARSTFALAEHMAAAGEKGATTIVGGGDSAAALRAAGLTDRITHVSTGGGASLELLEGNSLPALEALEDS